jgi:hypothetical protein
MKEGTVNGILLAIRTTSCRAVFLLLLGNAVETCRYKEEQAETQYASASQPTSIALSSLQLLLLLRHGHVLLGGNNDFLLSARTGPLALLVDTACRASNDHP